MRRVNTRLVAVLASALIGGMLPASTAGAATVTLGHVAPIGSTDPCATCTDFQLQTDSGSPSYVVPGGGPWTVTSWSTRGGTVSSQMQLRIFRATGTPNQYKLVAESAMETVSSDATPSLATSIPVEAGDLLGVRTGDGNYVAGSAAPHFPGAFSNDVVGLVSDAPVVGDTVGGGGGDPTVNPHAMGLINASATLTTPPTTPPPTTTPTTPPPTTPPTPPPTPPAAAATCKGITATIVGTEGADQITGTPGADVIVALGGNDKLSGLAGNDVICGGSGNDVLSGGKGDDALLGQGGDDKLKGKPGRDTLKGGAGKDTLKGGPGKDILKGGPGKDKQVQ